MWLEISTLHNRKKKMPRRKSRQTKAYSDSDSEYDDEIQAYHKERDKILLDSDHGDSNVSEDEEVYQLEESDSQDEEIEQMQQQLRQIKRNQVKQKLGSDLEDGSDSDNEALPDSRAWGSKKSWFMGGDVRDNKIILSGEEDEAGAAALEEAEMEKIEKRQLAQMSEEDYLPHSLMMRLKKKEKKQKRTKSAETGTGDLDKIKIKTDFSKLPKGAEFERLKEMHPEYAALFKDFGLKMKELQHKIVPLMGLVKTKKIGGLGATYLQMKFHIISNYLICGGFYFYLMSKKTPRVHHHPVMKRLLELQEFYNRLVPLDKRVKADLDHILQLLRQGKDLEQVVCQVPQHGDAYPLTGKMKAHKAKQKEGPAVKKRKVSHDSGSEDEDGDELGDLQEAEDDDDDEIGRRAITNEMEKNKGLTAHRKKELKNPRVKHRKKYRRALIRRKGQVRDFKPPKTAYSGEMTGIRSGIIRSRKLK